MMLQWVCPTSNQSITDIALHLVWQADDNASQYTVEMDNVPSFATARRWNAPQHPGCKVAFYLPANEELPAPGTWYLRATADTGAQTEVLQITINAEHPKAPLRWELSAEKPYFTIFDYSEHDYSRVHGLLPDILKPLSAIGHSTSYRVPSAQLGQALMEVDAEGVPWHLGASGPHVVNGEKYTITPLSTIEHLLQNAENMKSVGLVEQYMGTKPEGDWRIDYFKRLVALCAKYGVPFIYSDGNRNWVEMASFTKRPVYMDFLREYADYVTLGFKQNHGNAAYTCWGAILGAWMDGACAHIGVQPENWYWNDAGFRDDVGQYYGYLQGNEQQLPPGMTAQMMLSGLSVGAAHYSMEGEGWLIQQRGNDDLELSPQGLAAVSLMQCIVANQLVPQKQQVLGQMKAAVQAGGWGEALGDAWTGGVYRTAFQNLYGITHGFELFPKQSRYGYLPFVTDKKESFKNLAIVDVEAMRQPQDMNHALDALYPPRFEGDAYITDAGARYVVMNSNENCDAPQSFAFAPQAADGGEPVCSRVEGALGLWQYFVLWQANGCLHVYAGAPENTTFTVAFKTADPLQSQAVGQGASLCWDESRQAMVLTLTGGNTPAWVVLGDALAVPQPAPLQNQPDNATYLSQLPFAGVATTGHWLPARNQCANQAFGRLPLSMNAVRCQNGLSFMRGTRIEFDLGGKYSSLTTTAGFDIDAWMPIIHSRDDIVWDRYYKTISLVFTITGDDAVLYRSPPLCSTQWKEVLHIPLAGVHRLCLQLEGDITSDTEGVEVYMDIGNPVLA